MMQTRERSQRIPANEIFLAGIVWAIAGVMVASARSVCADEPKDRDDAESDIGALHSQTGSRGGK
ncbi:MAG: hypothetical protein QOF70_1341 [Acetobacteraceae bacterium]|nr:hypothetical protein [Acetobacteraceae bacterium]